MFGVWLFILVVLCRMIGYSFSTFAEISHPDVFFGFEKKANIFKYGRCAHSRCTPPLLHVKSIKKTWFVITRLFEYLIIYLYSNGDLRAFVCFFVMQCPHNPGQKELELEWLEAHVYT